LKKPNAETTKRKTARRMTKREKGPAHGPGNDRTVLSEYLQTPRCQLGDLTLEEKLGDSSCAQSRKRDMYPDRKGRLEGVRENPRDSQLVRKDQKTSNTQRSVGMKKGGTKPEVIPGSSGMSDKVGAGLGAKKDKSQTSHGPKRGSEKRKGGS